MIVPGDMVVTTSLSLRESQHHGVVLGVKQSGFSYPGSEMYVTVYWGEPLFGKTIAVEFLGNIKKIET